MEPRAASPSRTVRGGGSQRPHPRSHEHEREGFLASALARLNLSRPCTPTLPRPFKFSDDGDAATHDDPGVWRTLSRVVSVHSGSPSEKSTQPLLSLGEPSLAQQYADEVVLVPLYASTTGEDAGWARERDGGTMKRLVFYQALLVQFGRCEPEELPTSITGCVKLLRRVHVCIPHYLGVVRRGGCVAKEFKQFESVAALRAFLHSGGKKGRAKKRVPPHLAKSEMLSPFLIQL